MKNILFSSIFFLVFLTVGKSKNNDPNVKEFVKEINQNYRITPNGKVMLSNKYGNIEIKTIEGNQVKVLVQIVVNASSEKSADAVFNRINIQTTGNRDVVTVETQIESQGKSWGILNFNWGETRGDFTINYFIEMPKTCEPNVDNKYGNVVMEDVLSSVNLIAKYGNVKLGNVRDKLNLEVKYGDVEIGNVGGLVQMELGYNNRVRIGETDHSRISISYSNMEMIKANDLQLESKYSKIKSKYLGILNYVGKYDHLDLEHVIEFIGDTKYTPTKIENLVKDLVLYNAYGSVDINEVSKDCERVTIDASYMPIVIGLSDDLLGYDLNLESSYSTIKLPLRELNIRYQDYDNHEKDLIAIKGNGKCKIDIDISHGKFQLMQK